MFSPYAQWNNQMLARRFPIKRINSRGIPVINTISVKTVGSIVVYQLCPWRYKQLCNEGLMLLRIDQIPTAGAGSSAFTVSLETSVNPSDTSTGTPLLNGVSEAETSNRIVKGSRLLVYFNKCQGIFQVVNDIPV